MQSVVLLDACFKSIVQRSLSLCSGGAAFAAWKFPIKGDWRIILMFFLVFTMALVTYSPAKNAAAGLFRKPLENQFIKSFLAYVPYVVLGAMTFRAFYFSTSPDGGFSLVYFLWFRYAGSNGLSLFQQRGLLLVAVSSVVVAFITQA